MPPTAELLTHLRGSALIVGADQCRGLAPPVRIKEGAVAVTAFGLENKNGNPENERLGVSAGLSGSMTHDFSGQSERRWPVAYADPHVDKYRVGVSGNRCKT